MLSRKIFFSMCCHCGRRKNCFVRCRTINECGIKYFNWWNFMCRIICGVNQISLTTFHLIQIYRMGHLVSLWHIYTCKQYYWMISTDIGMIQFDDIIVLILVWSSLQQQICFEHLHATFALAQNIATTSFEFRETKRIWNTHKPTSNAPKWMRMDTHCH